MARFKEHSATIMFKVALALMALPMLSAAWADDADPSSRVARLGYVQGQVSIQPAGVDDWAAADLNRPIATGDKLWADADSRAELSIGSAFVRLSSGTAFSFLNLDDHIAQMQVTAGTVSIHVRSMSDQLELDTPNVAVALLGPGDYRLDVNDAGDATDVQVTNGTAEVTGGGQDFAVHPQQAATFSGTAQVTENLASLGPPDAFDTWSYDRDREAQEAQAWDYVPPDTVGAEDLDQYGTWQQTPDEGYVWSPNSVAVGWAPYRFGHWIWVEPWGWTWVDSAPWGFAPFHYGRWATFGGRWCWVPGPRNQPAVYAPALVAWAGGAALGPSAAFGGAAGIGWFPLGPHEVYVPAYPASASYIERINFANTRVGASTVTQVYNHRGADIRYLNRYTPGAITAVSATAFTAATPVGRNSVRIGPAELGSVTVSAAAPAVTPETKSVLGGGASGPGIRRPPPVLQNRVVLAKTAPAPAPVPFALVQQAIRENSGRPLGRSEITAMAILAPAAHVRITTPAFGAVARTGIARAAMRGTAPSQMAPPTPPSRAGPALRQESTPPAYPTEPAPRPAVRVDRPPPVQGAPAEENRPASTTAASPVEGARSGSETRTNALPSRPPVVIRTPPVYSPPPAPPPENQEPESEPRPAKRAPQHATSHPSSSSSERRP
jgi:hypothetical protein